MKVLTIMIEGMSCEHCKKALETAISQLEGVNSVEVDLDRNLAEIEVEDESAEQRIRQTIADAGYKPQ